jgi:hypothetical protein
VQFFLKIQIMQFGFMNVIVSYSDHRHVSATYVAVFRGEEQEYKYTYNVRGSGHSYKAKLRDIKLWTDPDILQMYLYSCCYHPEDSHMLAQNMSVVIT